MFLIMVGEVEMPLGWGLPCNRLHSYEAIKASAILTRKKNRASTGFEPMTFTFFFY